MIRELRMYIFVKILRIACSFLPGDAVKTWQWLAKMPIND